ncbi:MAG: CPBP family intramembrane metalloprotease [Bacteroidales bacterium]|nr:CPBP family intramembrane metalloprotease [Bacteroidales bacterium]
MILDKFIGALLQVLIFGIIPLLVYLFSKKRLKGFFRYIGLIKPVKRTIVWAIVVSFILIITSILLPAVFPEIKELMTMQGTVAGNLKAMGLSFSSVIILTIMALIKTSFSEEILFRGFIAKRLISWLGYTAGNLIQAIIFGLMHVGLLLLISEPNYPFLIFVFIFSGIAGYLLGYIKEKIGNGSIIPGWIAHGMANLISFYLVAFVM